MQDGQFALLKTVLRDMEKEDLSHSDLETTINHLIKRFDQEVTPEQKNAILREFLRYERIRRDKKDGIRLLKKMREEEHRESLNSFLNGDELGV